MQEVPPEIWYHVGSFLPDRILRELLSVNRPFFELSLAVRYRVLAVCVHETEALKKLKRFRQRTIVKKYVRVVKIEAISELITDKSRMDLVFTSFLDVIKTLGCIWELHMRFYCNSAVASDGFGLFFSSLWKSLTSPSQIKCLHLDSNLSSISMMLPAKHSLRDLEELFLSIKFMPDDVIKGQSVLTMAILPLINDYSSQLRTIAIDTVGVEETWSIFEGLHNFTLLRRFSLSHHEISSDDRLVTSLQYWIPRHAADLTYFSLKWFVWDGDDDASSTCIIPSCLLDELAFRKLRVLDLHPSKLSAEYIPTLRKVLSRCQDTLEVFTFRHPIGTDQLLEVVDLLKHCPRLSTLSFAAANVADIIVFDALSTLLKLNSLTMHWERSHRDPEFLRQVADLLPNFQSRSYAQWRLDDIGIYCYDGSISLDSMKTIASSIPSLQSFWGQGHMDAAARMT